METKVTAFAASPDATVGQSSPPVPQPAKSAPPPPAPPSNPAFDLRLVIEEDQGSGSFVYKTINRFTGEDVQQVPRAEVLKLRAEADYAPGAVIKTEA